MSKSEDNKENIGSINKYISVTYLWMHLLLITSYTALLMFIIMQVEQKYMWHVFMTASFTFTFSLWGVYLLSKHIKQKKNKLNIHRVKIIWSSLYIGLSLVWMCIVSMICGLAQAMTQFNMG